MHVVFLFFFWFLLFIKAFGQENSIYVDGMTDIEVKNCVNKLMTQASSANQVQRQ